MSDSDIKTYQAALRNMARDFIEAKHEEASWGDFIDGKWVPYDYPITEEMIDLLISDYVNGTTNFFYGKLPPTGT